jgi:hypothetical protein
MSDEEELYKRFAPGTLWKSFHYREIGWEKKFVNDWYFFRDQNIIQIQPESCLFVIEPPKVVFRYKGDSPKRQAGGSTNCMKVLITPGGGMGWLCFTEPSRFSSHPLLYLEEIT